MSDKRVTRILFVCMGNICRSPTAEYVFRKMVEDGGEGDRFEIVSAGTHAYHVGHGADPRSVQAGKRRGYDLSGHSARRVSDEDFEYYDYVFAMDRDNLAILQGMCRRGAPAKVELFLNHARGAATNEVPDPYFGESGFDLVLDLIEDASAGLLDHCREARDGGS